jgi:transposase
MTSTAMAGTVLIPGSSARREFAAWLGLNSTPEFIVRQTTRHNKDGRDGYLHTLLVCGAAAVIRFDREEASAKTERIRKLLEKKPAPSLGQTRWRESSGRSW